MSTTFSTEQTLQEGLNQVVINKVHNMIANKQVGVTATIQRLIEEGKISRDFIAPIGVNLKKAGDKPLMTFTANGAVNMEFTENDEGVFTFHHFNLHDNAVGQLAERMGIPQRYLRNLAGGKEDWQRALAAHLLNTHSEWTQRSRVLVRAVGEQVRGVLSDSYRRLDAQQILVAFIEQASGLQAVVADAYMNDTKVWAETILPQPFIIPTAKNGDVVLFAGARISTSDYGDGALDMRSFLLNGACLNGMVRESVMRQVHIGGKLKENLALSQQTYDLDTKTTVSAIQDLTKNLFSRETIERKYAEIQGASEMEVDFDNEIKKLTSNGAMLKQEGECVKKILMEGRPEDGVQGAPTLWKLTQAITAHARELSPERSRELHELGGSLLNRVKVEA